MRKLIVAVVVALGLAGTMAVSFVPSADAGQHRCRDGSNNC